MLRNLQCSVSLERTIFKERQQERTAEEENSKERSPQKEKKVRPPRQKETEVQVRQRRKKKATRNQRQRGRIGSRTRRKTEERHAGRGGGGRWSHERSQDQKERRFHWKVEGRHGRARRTVCDEGLVHGREMAKKGGEATH